MITVLIVDDSKFIREILTEVITSIAGICVVGAAEDAYQARELIKQHNPDVVTLDVEMPKMDGLTFLKNLMRLRPLPVVMLSTLTQQGADTTLTALEIGAVDFISKPQNCHLQGDLSLFKAELATKLRLASQMKISAKRSHHTRQVEDWHEISEYSSRCIIALGASTGGTQALTQVLSALPANAPAVLVTQHIPATFSRRFAMRLDKVCAMSVKEAVDGDVITQGHVYIAPGGYHLTVEWVEQQYGVCRLESGPARNMHKPSVDVMFDSLYKLNDVKVIAGLLTGMGTDGAQGLRRIKECGHFTLIQNEQTSFIWGMPGAASRLNAQWQEVALSDIASVLLQQINR